MSGLARVGSTLPAAYFVRRSRPPNEVAGGRSLPPIATWSGTSVIWRCTREWVSVTSTSWNQRPQSLPTWSASSSPGSDHGSKSRRISSTRHEGAKPFLPSHPSSSELRDWRRDRQRCGSFPAAALEAHQSETSEPSVPVLERNRRTVQRTAPMHVEQSCDAVSQCDVGVELLCCRIPRHADHVIATKHWHGHSHPQLTRTSGGLREIDFDDDPGWIGHGSTAQAAFGLVRRAGTQRYRRSCRLRRG